MKENTVHIKINIFLGTLRTESDVLLTLKETENIQVVLVVCEISIHFLETFKLNYSVMFRRRDWSLPQNVFLFIYLFIYLFI